MIRYGKYTEFWRGSFFCKISIFHFQFHILVFINIPSLKFIFGLLYTPVAHEVLPVSLVDSVTAKVDDEKKTLHTIYTCDIHHVIYFLKKVFIYFLYGFYIPHNLCYKAK